MCSPPYGIVHYLTVKGARDEDAFAFLIMISTLDKATVRHKAGLSTFSRTVRLCHQLGCQWRYAGLGAAFLCMGSFRCHIGGVSCLVDLGCYEQCLVVFISGMVLGSTVAVCLSAGLQVAWEFNRGLSCLINIAEAYYALMWRLWILSDVAMMLDDRTLTSVRLSVVVTGVKSFPSSFSVAFVVPYVESVLVR